MRLKAAALGTVTLITIVILSTHSAATLALDITVVDATCDDDGINSIVVETSGSVPLQDLVWHVWSQQQRTQFSWNASINGSQVTLTPPISDAQPTNSSIAQVAANLGQRRAIDHFKTEVYC